MDQLKNRTVLQSPLNYLADRRMLVDYHQKQLNACIQRQLDGKKQALIRLAAGLDAMSPLKVLSRGYSMTKNGQGHILTDAAALSVGDTITVMLRNGELDAAVQAIRGGEHE